MARRVASNTSASMTMPMNQSAPTISPARAVRSASKNQ